MTSNQKRIPYEEWKAMHPEKYGYQGRGKYSLKKFGRDLNKAGKTSVGRAIRKAVINEADNLTGGTASQVVSAYKGRGSYMTGRGAYMTGRGAYMTGRGAYYTNALINGDSHNTIPKHNGSALDENGSIMIEKREFVTSINATGSANFSVESFAINAGLKAIFPWLSQSATNYAEQEWFQCIFEYEPVVSETSVSSVGSLGTVVMAANYNAGDANFESFPAMIEYSGAVRGRISDNISCGIECHPDKLANESHLYVRAGAVPDGQDIKTYDLAKFQLGLYGVPTQYVAGTQIGLLFVRYKVKLSKPKLYDSLGYAIGTDAFWGSNVTGGNTLTMPLGTAPRFCVNNSIGGVMNKITNNNVTLPDDFEGTLEVSFIVSGNAAAAGFISPSIALFGNVTSQNYFLTNTGGNSAYVQSIGTGQLEIATRTFTVGPPSVPNANVISFSCSNLPTTPYTFVVRVQEINPQVRDIASAGNFASV